MAHVNVTFGWHGGIRRGTTEVKAGSDELEIAPVGTDPPREIHYT
jgi:hypothetical protein